MGNEVHDEMKWCGGSDCRYRRPYGSSKMVSYICEECLDYMTRLVKHKQEPEVNEA